MAGKYVLANKAQQKMMKELGTPMEPYKGSKKKKAKQMPKAPKTTKATGPKKKRLSEHMKSMYTPAQLKKMGY
jgi:hypothetical protein